MSVKDYYKVLQIPVGSDSTTIKKAFRKLALEHHPDKKGESQESNAYYREIQEAYEVLSDPNKKENYLFKRWLNQVHDVHQDKPASAEEFISHLIKTEKFLSGLDVHRIDKYVWFDFLQNLLQTDQLNLIKEKKDQNLTNEVLRLSFQLCSPLNSSSTESILNQLISVFDFESFQEDKWFKEIKRKKKLENWEIFKVPVFLLLTLLICWFIFRITR